MKTPQELGITEEQFSNFEKLASYLLLGNLKAKFNMGQYSESQDFLYIESDCGSIGCAIGHGPYSGIQKFNIESWGEYSSRVFGISIWSDTIDAWDFLFGPDWVEIDNTPQGAAKRIQYFLKKWSSD